MLSTVRTQIGSDFAWRVLEEIDYGLILVGPDGKVQHANHLARHELARARFLRTEQDVDRRADDPRRPAKSCEAFARPHADGGR